MNNFFVATITYLDGSIERVEGRLYFLGGIRDEAGHAKLAELRADLDAGRISHLHVDYES